MSEASRAVTGSDGAKSGLTLDVIMRRFSAPLNELQAWAIIHQCLKSILALGLDPSTQTASRGISMSNVVIGTDGGIYFSPGLQMSCCEVSKPTTLLNELGLLVFALLDYGVEENEEQPISPSLECLIDSLTSNQLTKEEENDTGCSDSPMLSVDSGIDDDCTLAVHFMDVLKLCEAGIPWVQDPDKHFKNICKNIIEEAISISHLMIRGSKDDESMENDMSQKWSQVIEQVKTGQVTLRHVSNSEMVVKLQPTLSQFDHFLISIAKFDRNSLRPAMDIVQSHPCSIKLLPEPENTHDSIMQQILAKPRLKSASKRGNYSSTLPARSLTPMEKLMADITGPHSLKPVTRISSQRAFKSASDLRYLGIEWDDSENDDNDVFRIAGDEWDSIRREFNTSSLTRAASVFDTLSDDTIPSAGYLSLPPPVTSSPPLSSSQSLDSPSPSHVSLCSQSPKSRSPSATSETLAAPFMSLWYRVKQAVTSQQQPQVTSESLINDKQRKEKRESGCTLVARPRGTPLSDIILIRTTLTNAELYNTQLQDRALCRDLQERKICFVCKSKRFGFLTRQHNCYICHQCVCSSCIVTKGSRWQLSRIQTADAFCICQTCQVFMNDNYSDTSICNPAVST